MTARTVIFAIGLTALAAFFALMGIAAYVARGWDDLFDVVTMCSIAAVLVWAVVLLVRGDGEQEQRGFEIEWDPKEEAVAQVVVLPADSETGSEKDRSCGDEKKHAAD